MNQSPRSTLLRYAFAFPVVVGATLARLALDPWLGARFPIAGLFVAILIVAGQGGRGPALLATALGGYAATDFLIAPRAGFSRMSAENQSGLVVYWAVGIGVAILGGSMRKAQRRAEVNAAEAIVQRELLRTTLASIGDAVIATDDRGRVRFMNPVAEVLTGWTQAEAASRPLEEVFRVVDEQTRRPADGPVARALREGVVVGLADHALLVSRDGSETPVEDSAAPIKDAAGAVVGAVMVFQDATGRRKHEAALRAAKDEAERANRAKDQFLAVLSHELRTPLNPILLATSSMLEEAPGPEELRPILEMIRQNVNLQARLIDDLLDVMRIVRGKMPMHWEVADAHALIRQAVATSRSEVYGKVLRLDLDLAAGRHHIRADPARFQQVIWNLVRNAVKFTPGGGSIAIRTRDREGIAGDRLAIEVVDTGIGIEPAALPLIFEPFQQGQAAVDRKFGGLGLGLAICRGVVASHGGTLEAESAGEGRGATFRICLATVPRPSAGDGAAVDGSPATAAGATPSLKILVVEDEPATRRLMARLLRGLGHEVTAAGTVAEAAEATGASAFDLIVSDIGLPDGTGLDLMRTVVAARGAVPSIALTGYGMEADIRRSREAGFTAHMTKPIDFAKLEAMIRQVAG